MSLKLIQFNSLITPPPLEEKENRNGPASDAQFFKLIYLLYSLTITIFAIFKNPN